MIRLFISLVLLMVCSICVQHMAFSVEEPEEVMSAEEFQESEARRADAASDMFLRDLEKRGVAFLQTDHGVHAKVKTFTHRQSVDRERVASGHGQLNIVSGTLEAFVWDMGERGIYRYVEGTYERYDPKTKKTIRFSQVPEECALWAMGFPALMMSELTQTFRIQVVSQPKQENGQSPARVEQEDTIPQPGGRELLGSDHEQKPKLAQLRLTPREAKTFPMMGHVLITFNPETLLVESCEINEKDGTTITITFQEVTVGDVIVFDQVKSSETSK